MLGPQASADSTQSKYAELVMKCLWKLTKALQATIQSGRLMVPDLLFDLHKFLTTTPPPEWKRRAMEKLPLGDMPLRTVKTILHELVTAVGVDILDQLALVLDEPKRSVVYSYLQHMLESSGMLEKQDMKLAQDAPASQQHSPAKQSSPLKEVAAPVSGGVPMPRGLSDREAVLAVDQIFARISSKEETKQVCRVLNMGIL